MVTRARFLISAYLLLIPLAATHISCQELNIKCLPVQEFRMSLGDDTVVFYRDSDPVSDSESAVVIIHGWLGSSYAFVPFMNELSPYMRTVAPDLPGCGQSSKPRIEYTCEYYVEILDQIREKLGLRSIVLVGSSMGAQIAARYADKYPERVTSIVFINPVGLSSQGRTARFFSRFERLVRWQAAKADRETVSRRLKKRSAVDERVITEEVISSYYRPLTTPSGRWALANVTSNIIGRSSVDDVLPLLKKPVLLVGGSRDSFKTKNYCDDYRALLTDETTVVLGNAKHMPALERPDALGAVVIDFVKKNGRY